jgi:hypothetical protein
MCRTTGIGESVNLDAAGMSAAPPLNWVNRSDPETIGIAARRISPVGMSQSPRKCRPVVALTDKLGLSVVVRAIRLYRIR